jgi:hypothetical protein
VEAGKRANKVRAENPAVGTRGNRGRPKGSLNKTTRIAKDAIAFVAEGLGGAERMIAWAQEDEKNEAAFWTSIYPKLLPLDVNANHSGAVKVLHVPFAKTALDQ